MATIRLPNAGPTTGLKSAKSRHYERRLLADFRPAVGPAFGSRMVANQIRADRRQTKTFAKAAKAHQHSLTTVLPRIQLSEYYSNSSTKSH